MSKVPGKRDGNGRGGGTGKNAKLSNFFKLVESDKMFVFQYMS